MITNQTLDLLRRSYVASFMDGFTSGRDVLWDRVATRVPSSSASSSYAWLGQFPELREWLGERAIKSLAQFNYTIVNRRYEATVAIQRDDIEDNTALEKSILLKEMGRAARHHPDKLVFDALAAGNTTLCYDGQYFFDVDHPVGSGVVSNNLPGAGPAWYLIDTTKAIKPLIYQVRQDYEFGFRDSKDFESVWRRNEIEMGVDGRSNVGYGLWQTAIRSQATLDMAGFDAAMAAIMAFKSDDGRNLGVSPTLLVVPPSLRGAAMGVLKSALTPAGGTNYNQNVVDVLVVGDLAV